MPPVLHDTEPREAYAYVTLMMSDLVCDIVLNGVILADEEWILADDRKATFHKRESAIYGIGGSNGSMSSLVVSLDMPESEIGTMYAPSGMPELA